VLTERYLYQIEEMLASKQNRKPCAIAFAEFPKSHEGIVSMFERDSYTIIFNIDMIDDLSEQEVLGSLIHEGRHAYQWYQVNHPDKTKEPTKIITAWTREFEDYLQPTDGTENAKYASQMLEIDAIAYTSILVEKLELGKLIIPEEIEALVLKRASQIKIN